MTELTVPRPHAPARRNLWSAAAGAALLVAAIVVHFAYMLLYGAMRPDLAAAAYPAHAQASGPYVALFVGIVGGLAVGYRVGLWERVAPARVVACIVGGYVALDVLLVAMAGATPDRAMVATWVAIATSLIVGGRLARRRLGEAHTGRIGA